MEESSVLPAWIRRWIKERRKLVIVISACVLAAIGALSVYALVTEDDQGVLIEEASEHDVAFDRVMGPRLEEAERIDAALEEAGSRPGTDMSYKAAVYGYDRQAFEWEGQELLDRLEIEHPDTFGGGALDPVDPFLHVAYVGEPEELERSVDDASLDAEFVGSPTTLAERERVAARLDDRGYSSDVGEFAERVVLSIAEDELRTDADRIAGMIAFVVDAPADQAGEIREALLTAPRSGVVIGPLVVVPEAPAG